MPRRIAHLLYWEEHAQRYILTCDHGDILPDSADWFHWLEENSSFSFRSREGEQYTVRKESLQRDTSLYWYVYKRIENRVHKKYLGKTNDFLLARLEEITHTFQKEGVAQDHKIDSAAAQLLESKLYPPHLPPALVERPHLFAQLDYALTHKLSLLTAPAGFGKTTLIGQWLKQREGLAHIGWLALDAGDNDPIRFWRYVIAACQKIQPAIGKEAYALLASRSQIPFDTHAVQKAITLLLNDLTHLKTRSLLVLDDYHLITESRIAETMQVFLDHVPVHLHVMLLVRSEPSLSLLRWRAHGDLYDIPHHLRFSYDESAAFLQQVLAYRLSKEHIEQIYQYTEGWATGLRLLAIALGNKQSQQEIDTHVGNLFESTHTIHDYFVQEILVTQTEDMQQFLLQVSILQQLSEPLCMAITGRGDSAVLLDKLERAGLFLQSIPSKQPAAIRWYQFHALFAQALREEAMRRMGNNVVNALIIKASDWFEMHNMLAFAIESALQAGDSKRAAQLIERLITKELLEAKLHNFFFIEFHTLCRWLEQLPQALLEQHPTLSFSYAAALLHTCVLGEIPLTAVDIMRINQCLTMAELSWEKAENRAQVGEVLAFRGLIARHIGDMDEAVALAKRALAYLPEENLAWRSISQRILHVKVIHDGQLVQARQLLQTEVGFGYAQYHRSWLRPGTVLLSRICIEQFELQQAGVKLRALLAEARADKDRDDIADALIDLGRIAYVGNKLSEAKEQAEEAYELSCQLAVEENIVNASLLLIQTQYAMGDVDVALQALRELLVSFALDGTERRTCLVRKILALQALFQLKAGNIPMVEQWHNNVGQDNAVLPMLQREHEQIVYARLLIAQEQEHEAIHLLEPLLQDAREAGRIRHVLEMQLLMTLAYARTKQMQGAKVLLQRVLVYAASEQAYRLLLDEGSSMALLVQTVAHDIQGEQARRFVRTLLTFFASPSPVVSGPTTSLVAASLSTQEQRVLQLLMQGCSNPEIARELIVSVNTVKTQIQHIYRKLNVNNRVEASEVARQLWQR